MKQFAFSFSNFASERFSVIPKNLAVEIAPGLISNAWYSLSDYITKPGIRFLAKTRLSLGTNEQKETGVNQVAFGLRSTLLDKGDFRRDTAFQKDSIYSKLAALHQYVDKQLEDWKLKKGIGVVAGMSDEAFAVIRDSIYGRAVVEMGSVTEIIARAIENYKKRNWNATRIDFAYSLLLQSRDSLVSNIKLNKHLLWTTFSLKPGKDNHWAQVLVGLNYVSYKLPAEWEQQFTGNFRLYVGANRLKGLLEVQYRNKDVLFANNQPSLFSQVGVEVSPYKGIWLQFSTGVFNALKENNKSALRSNLNISLTFPEDLKLF